MTHDQLDAAKPIVDAWMRENDIVATGSQYLRMLELAARAMAPAEPAVLPRRCQQCNAPRNGDACHKCGSATQEPCTGWEEPALPPVDRIRELAREIGYAIGEHGTKERDLDLIAAPWTEQAAKLTHEEVMQHIADGLGARILDIEWKALGRRACTIQMDGWFKPIDLSVCPAVATEWEAE